MWSHVACDFPLQWDDFDYRLLYSIFLLTILTLLSKTCASVTCDWWWFDDRHCWHWWCCTCSLAGVHWLLAWWSSFLRLYSTLWPPVWQLRRNAVLWVLTRVITSVIISVIILIYWLVQRATLKNIALKLCNVAQGLTSGHIPGWAGATQPLYDVCIYLCPCMVFFIASNQWFLWPNDLAVVES